jgi:hypothetical protein
MTENDRGTLELLPGKTIRVARINLDAHSAQEHIEDIVFEFTDGTLLEIVIDANAEGRPLRTDVTLLLREDRSRETHGA